MARLAVVLVLSTALFPSALPSFAGDIHRAIEAGDAARVAQILAAEPGADVDAGDSDNSAAPGIAATRRHGELVGFLIERGADVNRRDRKADCPLSFAVYGRDEAIIQQLLDAGADLYFRNPRGETLLHISCARGVRGSVEHLLENGAEIDRPDVLGNTPLLIAAETSSADLVKLLIDHGAAVNRLNENGQSALVKASSGGYADRVEALLSAKADPNLGTDEGGRTALQLAALGGHREVARLLVAAGADVGAPTAMGRTPIELARYYGHEDVASLLDASGAKSGGSKSVDRSLAALGNVDDGEAVVWFLGHSGWAVKTAHHLLIFDYFSQGEEPAKPGLHNGHVNAAEMAGEKVVVFASHEHGDHFSPIVFGWREQVPDITYFLGLQPRDTLPYEFMPERVERSYGDIKLTTVHSTDAGVGMVVEVDGLTIFHAGDHANGALPLMTEFTDEIDFLAAKGVRPDICMMGIRGCSLGTPDQVKEGVYYALKTLKPKAFLPMHAGAQGRVYHEFIEQCGEQFGSIQMVAADNRGDHFVFKKGKIKDPKSRGSRQARAD